MSRRRFVLGLAAGISAPRAGRAFAQRTVKTHRLGILAEVTAPSDLAGAEPKAWTIRHVLARLGELGYRYGDNLAVEVRSAEGDVRRFPDLARELMRANVDIILATSNRGALAAKQASAVIPIVMAGANDPVGFGLVDALPRPGGNVTGIALDTGPEIAAKRVELLKELTPNLRRLSYFVPTLIWFERPGGKAVQDAASRLGITLAPVVVTTREQLDGAAAAVRNPRADALLVEAYVFPWSERRAFVDFALAHRLPTMFGNPDIVSAGGLAAYSADFGAIYRRAAEYVDLILKGGKPADMPVEQPTQFRLTLNMKTAASLGLTISRSLLVRADQVID